MIKQPKWYDHTLRTPTEGITHNFVGWNPQGNHRQGQHKFVW